MRDYEQGPVVQICRPSRVAATSKALGLPVGGGDGGLHDPQCGGCGGEKDDTGCPYSVRIQRYVDSLPYPPSQAGEATTP
jgi:hypothetical protein